jgi:AraC-like DNA-binding protein
MRLTFSTDYALRLLTLVGLEIDRLLTIEEVADRFGISNNHLMNRRLPPDAGDIRLEVLIRLPALFP